MPFNHYAKLKRLLADYPGWYIVQINEPTSARNFKGELRQFDYYYRLYTADGTPIKFGKFQQLDLLAKTLSVPPDALRVVTQPIAE